ncbi:AAA family ATPase [Rhizobium laguerreae]|uniref:AAA family ATPase n=1 Tax=Rhizobium laguerreae TaxID=1076926 RepID=UPI001C8FE192|nr:AAA family ATPase [Rhizobium laguerreae]MBY3123491.1 AAA family ATPase [Rhizobium laguerreae]
MDIALRNNLDKYISRLQEVARGSRSISLMALRKGSENRTAASKSATLFLAYCALTSLLRRIITSLAEPSCVAIIDVPATWQLEDVVEAAKFIFKDQKQPRVVQHPRVKHRRGWEIDTAELLESKMLIVFVQEGSPVHEDFELAVTVRDRLSPCEPRHIRAISQLRGCGEISYDGAKVIAQQPSTRMEAIFRFGQPAQRAVSRLSQGNSRQPQKDKIRHVDISKGFGAASLWAMDLKKDIQEWREGRLAWAEVDKGCLLYGPTGTGKTRFAVALADACEMALEVGSIAQWQAFKDGDLGDMLKAMQQSFTAAKENAPSILFIDEFDSIGDRKKFPARHATYSTTVVNALLEALDGVEGHEGVVVVGACNDPEKVDSALVRNGRLETHIHFPMPDAASRNQILAFHLPSLADDPALKEIAGRLVEKSGADLERLSRDVRRVARREGRVVSIDDLRKRLDPLPVLTDEQILQVAIHEAGHAIAAEMLKVGKVTKVQVFDNVIHFSDALEAHGLTSIELSQPAFETRWGLKKLITYHMAGSAAEEVFFKDNSTMAAGSSTSDFARATKIAIRMVTEFGLGTSRYHLPDSIDFNSPLDLWQDHRLADEVNTILHEQYGRAVDMLSGLDTWLKQFAMILAERKVLEHRDLRDLWAQLRGYPT